MIKFNELFGKKDVGRELTRAIPYALKLRFLPFRMDSRSKQPVHLEIEIESLIEEPLLTSVVIQVSKAFGFDAMGLNSTREIRLSYLQPGEKKQLTVDLYSSARIKAGEFPVHVTAYSHYRDYSHILNYERKRISLRVV